MNYLFRMYPMAQSPRHPMAAAMQWVSRIMAAGLMMVLPGLAGQWLDGWLVEEHLVEGQRGTGFFVLIGFAAGLTLSIAYLIAITKPPRKKP